MSPIGDYLVALLWHSWLGAAVSKISKKPFKSGSKVNTIKSVTINKNTNRLAFTFKEDDSVVDCYQCYKID